MERLEELWNQAIDIWSKGGWAMYVIAVVALVMFGLGMHIHLKLRKLGIDAVPESTWRHWLHHPRERRGYIGRILDFVAGGRTIQDTQLYFEQLRTSRLPPYERDLKVMKTCVSAAPLVGLLGTVTGMLTTFAALAGGSGGEKTMAQIAGGISEALITTETGLVIALPGLFFHAHLQRGYERYKAFLAHLETVCTQAQYHRDHERRRMAKDPQRAAKARIARAILRQTVRQPAPRRARPVNPHHHIPIGKD